MQYGSNEGMKIIVSKLSPCLALYSGQIHLRLGVIQVLALVEPQVHIPILLSAN
jgi:hypothetical protein